MPKTTQIKEISVSNKILNFAKKVSSKTLPVLLSFTNVTIAEPLYEYLGKKECFKDKEDMLKAIVNMISLTGTVSFATLLITAGSIQLKKDEMKNYEIASQVLYSQSYEIETEMLNALNKLSDLGVKSLSKVNTPEEKALLKIAKEKSLMLTELEQAIKENGLDELAEVLELVNNHWAEDKKKEFKDTLYNDDNYRSIF